MPATAIRSRPSRHPRSALRCRERSSPDRKSTRLNSSHLVISYAVFCLKKKSVVVDLDEIGLSQGGSRGHLTPQYMGCVAGFERAAGNRAVSAVSSLVLLN